MKLWQAYKYTYYWLYTWQKKLWGKNDLPEYNIVFGISLSLVCFATGFSILTNILFNIHLIPPNINKVKVIPFLISVFLIHYGLFIHRNKYKQIEKEFQKESQAERKRKGFWVLLYTFGSMAFPIFTTFLGIWLRNNGYTPLIKYLGL